MFKRKKICCLTILNKCCNGRLVIYKEIKTKQIFVKCSDCEATYESIEDALHEKNPIKDTFEERVHVTLDEMKEMGYEKYVEEIW